MNTNLKFLRLAFHPAITCNTGTLGLKHANKGNVQVEKIVEEQRLQKLILLHQKLMGYRQRKRPAYPTGIEIGIWRLLKLLSVQTQVQNELKKFNSRSSNKQSTDSHIFNLCKCRKTP